MSVSPFNPSACQQQLVNKQQGDRQSLNQLSARQKKTIISLTTAEGDKVTLSSNSAAALAISSQSNNNSLTTGQTFSVAAMHQEELTFSVQGDLNDEELADIAALYNDLANIASSFYSGDYAGAMTGAMSIGDMGSISQLNASFSYQEISASQLTSHHVMPTATAADLQQAFADLPTTKLFPRAPGNDPKDVLKAQWQQIENFLDQQEQQPPATIPPTENQATAKEDKNPAQQMIDHLDDLISSHPRLAPFALPLAHRAIEQEASSRPNPLQSKQSLPIKNALLHEFQRWLAA